MKSTTIWEEELFHSLYINSTLLDQNTLLGFFLIFLTIPNKFKGQTHKKS